MKRNLPLAYSRGSFHIRLNFGFSLIELLVSITLLSILAGVGVAGYRLSVRKQTMDAAYSQVTGLLRQAQANAQSGKKINCATTLAGWQVRFNATSVVLEESCASTYSVSIFELPLGVTLTTLPSPNPTLFRVLNRGTNVPSLTDIGLTGFNLTRTITVTATGEIR